MKPIVEVNGRTNEKQSGMQVLNAGEGPGNNRYSYTGIAARGYVHRLVDEGERQYRHGNENHIKDLEGFWGFLKRKLVSKGGIRKEKLPLYPGEYVWRYNHRNDSDNDKIKRIIRFLEKEV